MIADKIRYGGGGERSIKLLYVRTLEIGKILHSEIGCTAVLKSIERMKGDEELSWEILRRKCGVGFAIN